MASTFSELYSDFLDAVKIYTEKLDINEWSFMRRYSRGMQMFQRETELLEAFATIPVVIPDNNFLPPTDLLRIVEVKDVGGRILLLQELTQLSRINERTSHKGYIETPTDYSMRLSGKSRMITMFGGIIYVDPFAATDTEINMWYIPDIHAISKASAQWAAWFDPADPTAFDTNFNARTLSFELAPYEDAILNWAIADYIKSQGSRNFQMFQSWYMAEVERAKLNKPVLHRESVRDYMMAPYS